MKIVKKITLLLTFFLSMQLFTGCEIQERFNTKSKNRPELRYISFNEFSSKKIANSKFIEINQKSKTATTSKLLYFAEYDFIIDTSQILYFQYEDYISYTFRIYKGNDDEKIENLVLIQKGTSIESYITKYILTTEEKDRILKNQAVNLTGKIDLKLLGKADDCWHRTTIDSVEGEDGIPHATAIHWHNSCTGEDLVMTVAIADSTSESSGGDSSSGGDNGPSGPLLSGPFFGSGWWTSWDGITDPHGSGGIGTNPGSNSGVTNPGGGNASNPYDGTNTSILDETYVITFPLLNSVKNYIPALNDEQLDYLAQNTRNTKQILLYLQENSSQERVDFVLSFINQDIISPFNLNFDLSFDSPCFIDNSSISGNTQEEVKFREIYNDLNQSQYFRDLFVNIFGSTIIANAKLTITDIPQTGNSYTRGMCTLYQIPNNPTTNVVITIDRQTLLTKSNATIALVILHECIHAYLDFKLENQNIGIPVSIINGMTFQECVNTYYDGFSGTQSQHSFFVDAMIPNMVTILGDIQDSIITPEQANQLVYPTNGAAYLWQPMGSPPSISDIQIQWNWTDYFTHLSYEGLQSSSSYPTIYPPNSNVNFVRGEYISAGNAILNP